MILIIWLVVTGTMEWIMTFHINWEWNVIIPTDFHSMIFRRGRVETTNQVNIGHGLKMDPVQQLSLRVYHSLPSGKLT